MKRKRPNLQESCSNGSDEQCEEQDAMVVDSSIAGADGAGKQTHTALESKECRSSPDGQQPLKSSLSLCKLPRDVLFLIMSMLDAKSLVKFHSACHCLAGWPPARAHTSRPSMSWELHMSASSASANWLECCAQACLHRRLGTHTKELERWRHYTWLTRLRIEDTESALDVERCLRAGFLVDFSFPLPHTSHASSSDGEDVAAEAAADDGIGGGAGGGAGSSNSHQHNNHDSAGARDSKQCWPRASRVKLEGVGPRLLVSKETTQSVGLLRWRLGVKGNNAVELGVVPEALQDNHKALHKCQEAGSERATGFFSSITVGSLLPVRVPVMRGSDMEVLAWPDKLEIIVNQPSNGLEMTWVNNATVPKPYMGPRRLRFEMDLQGGPVKLALTCWAHAEFEMLGPGGMPFPSHSTSAPLAPHNNGGTQQQGQGTLVQTNAVATAAASVAPQLPVAPQPAELAGAASAPFQAPVPPSQALLPAPQTDGEHAAAHAPPAAAPALQESAADGGGAVGGGSPSVPSSLS